MRERTRFFGHSDVDVYTKWILSIVEKKRILRKDSVIGEMLRDGLNHAEAHALWKEIIKNEAITAELLVDGNTLRPKQAKFLIR